MPRIHEPAAVSTTTGVACFRAGLSDAIRSVRLILTVVTQTIANAKAEYDAKHARRKEEEEVQPQAGAGTAPSAAAAPEQGGAAAAPAEAVAQPEGSQPQASA